MLDSLTFGLPASAREFDFPISTIYLQREWVEEYLPEGLASAGESAFNTRHDWLEYASDSDMDRGISPLTLAIREVKSLSALSNRAFNTVIGSSGNLLTTHHSDGQKPLRHGLFLVQYAHACNTFGL